MRLFIAILLIAVLSALAECLLPWWSVAFVSFCTGALFTLRPGKAFVAGFLGVGLCWLAFILYRDMANAHILSHRMAALFGLPSRKLFILVSVLIGALVGGLSALAGAKLRR